MSEQPTLLEAPNKLKLRKATVKDLALSPDRSGNVQGGRASGCVAPSSPSCGTKTI